VKVTWVQDAKTGEALNLVAKANGENLDRCPVGSKYVLGVNKNAKPGEVGIYFEDPTG